MNVDYEKMKKLTYYCSFTCAIVEQVYGDYMFTLNQYRSVIDRLGDRDSLMQDALVGLEYNEFLICPREARQICYDFVSAIKPDIHNLSTNSLIFLIKSFGLDYLKYKYQYKMNFAVNLHREQELFEKRLEAYKKYEMNPDENIIDANQRISSVLASRYNSVKSLRGMLYHDDNNLSYVDQFPDCLNRYII